MIVLVVIAGIAGLSLIVVGSAEAIIWGTNGPTDSPWWREVLRVEACVLLISAICTAGIAGPALLAMAVLP